MNDVKSKKDNKSDIHIPWGLLKVVFVVAALYLVLVVVAVFMTVFHNQV